MLFNKKTKLLKEQQEEIRKLSYYLKKLSDGEFDFDMSEPNGAYPTGGGNQFVEINQSVKTIRNSLNGLVEDTKSLQENIKNGNLDCHIDAAKYSGFYSVINRNINETVDTIIKPFDEANTILKKLEVSDYTSYMKNDYKGAFLEFSDLINALIKRLIDIQNVFIKVSQGDVSPLEDMRAVGKRSENDKMMPAAISMMQAIQNVVVEIGRITTESVNGNIRNARCDAGNLTGGYREIVTGVNNLLDSVSKPMDELMPVLAKNVDQRLFRQYEGRL